MKLQRCKVSNLPLCVVRSAKLLWLDRGELLWKTTNDTSSLRSVKLPRHGERPAKIVGSGDRSAKLLWCGERTKLPQCGEKSMKLPQHGKPRELVHKLMGDTSSVYASASKVFMIDTWFAVCEVSMVNAYVFNFGSLLFPSPPLLFSPSSPLLIVSTPTNNGIHQQWHAWHILFHRRTRISNMKWDFQTLKNTKVESAMKFQTLENEQRFECAILATWVCGPLWVKF